MKLSENLRPVFVLIVLLLTICQSGLLIRAKRVIHQNSRDAYYQYCIVMQSNIDNNIKNRYTVSYKSKSNMRELSNNEKNNIEHQVRIETAKNINNHDK